MTTILKKLSNDFYQQMGIIHFLVIFLAIYPCQYFGPIDYLCQALKTGICQK